MSQLDPSVTVYADIDKVVIRPVGQRGDDGQPTYVFIGVDPPDDPVEGELWWDSVNGRMMVWYVDIDGGQWVDTTALPDITPADIGAVATVTGDGVDNTDPTNPVLTFPTPAEIGAIPTSEKGVASGVASLGADGKLASTQLVGTYASVLPLKGRYCRLGGDGPLTFNAPSNNMIRLTPFSTPYDVTIDQIGVSWDTPGEVGSKVKIGIYGPLLENTALENVPLLFDAGFVDGGAVAGDYYITIEQTLKAGIYFVANLAYDAPTTRPRMRATSPGANLIFPFGSFSTSGTFVSNQDLGFQGTITGGNLPVDLSSVTLTPQRGNIIQARLKA